MKKEKYIWLPITAIPVALIGMILSFISVTKLQGFGLIGCGLILTIIGLALNFKSNHFLSLLTLFILGIVINISLFTQQMKRLLNTTPSYYQTDSRSSFSNYDSTNTGSSIEASQLTVSELEQHSQSDTVTIGNETVRINSVTNTDKNYIAINVTITNNSEEELQYSNRNFEVSIGDSDSIMDGIYSAIASDDLGETKFAYISSGSIKPGESITGDLLYDDNYSSYKADEPKYLVINDSVHRVAAIKLN